MLQLKGKDCQTVLKLKKLYLQETHLKYKDGDRLKVKEQEKIHANMQIIKEGDI